MRLKNIKTKEQFYEYADIQYQRTHALRRIWQHVRETPKRREKAFMLWGAMVIRMQLIHNVALTINR